MSLWRHSAPNFTESYIFWKFVYITIKLVNVFILCQTLFFNIMWGQFCTLTPLPLCLITCSAILKGGTWRTQRLVYDEKQPFLNWRHSTLWRWQLDLIIASINSERCFVYIYICTYKENGLDKENTTTFQCFEKPQVTQNLKSILQFYVRLSRPRFEQESNQS
jgi:hypothetical protein